MNMLLHASTRRTAAWAVALGLALSACSGSDPAPGSTDEAAPDPEPVAESTTEAEVLAADQVRDPGTALWIYPPVEGAILTTTQVVFGQVVETTTEVTSVSGGQVNVTQFVDDGSDGIRTHLELHTSVEGGTSMDPAGLGYSGTEVQVIDAGPPIGFPPLRELEAGAVAEGSTFLEFELDGTSFRNDTDYSYAGVGWETVTVPAGTYEAYRIDGTMHITSSFGEIDGTASLWFVPGFALVKSVIDTGEALTVELTSSTV